MNIFFAPDISKGDLSLPYDEAVHCSRVLRRTIGDKIEVIDGEGTLYNCTIIDIGKKSCVVEIVDRVEQFGAVGYNLHIAIAPTKNIDRIEWFVEKSTEIGINSITFLRCKNSERVVIKPERLEKIAVSAIKQSLKARKPMLSELIDFRQFVKECGDVPHKFIAYCGSEHPKLELKELALSASENQVLILIGPEGDFSPEEVEVAINNGFIPLSLGSSRLRTETAALYATALISAKY